MNTKRFVTLTLILTLLLVCSLYYSTAGIYSEDAIDFASLATTMTLNATDLIVGEVIHVSFVFEQNTSGPISLVTVQVDKDMKEAIMRADNPTENQEPEESKADEQTISFVQVGGPLPDGDVVEAAGVRRLKEGDYVFLRLVPSGYPVTHNGQTVHSCTEEYGTMFDVEKTGDNVDQHMIKNVWNRLNISVLDMIRIVRATLRQPEQMRSLDRDMNELKYLTEEARLEMLMDKVKDIEKVSNLPDLSDD